MYWYHFCVWENIDSKTTFQRKHNFLKKKVDTKDTFAEKRCDSMKVDLLYPSNERNVDHNNTSLALNYWKK
jgi:hypothetical protein